MKTNKNSWNNFNEPFILLIEYSLFKFDITNWRMLHLYLLLITRRKDSTQVLTKIITHASPERNC